jgi:hypothetical protein
MRAVYLHAVRGRTDISGFVTGFKQEDPMFTGLVEGIGKIKEISRFGEIRASRFLRSLKCPISRSATVSLSMGCA